MAAQDTRLESRKSQVTEDMVRSVRQKLAEKENEEVDDTMLNQFLRATRHDVDKVSLLTQQGKILHYLVRTGAIPA